MNVPRRVLEVLLLSQVQDALKPLVGRPWTPELAGETTRRIVERFIVLFPTIAGTPTEQDIRRIVAEVVHSVVREMRSKEKP